jgi:hypothetical protein
MLPRAVQLSGLWRQLAGEINSIGTGGGGGGNVVDRTTGGAGSKSATSDSMMNIEHYAQADSAGVE